MKEGQRKLTLDRPATYQIKVPGELDESWSDWLGAMTITVVSEGEGLPITTLTGTADQAALHSVLRRLYSLGLPLISVICVSEEFTDRRGRMNTNIKTARVVGALFITATAAAMVSGAFLLPILGAPDYLVKVSANENRVMMGALFYFIMAAAGASIAIPMYPILRKHHEGLALGAVGFRLIEGAIFMVGVFCVLSLVKVSEGFVQAGAPDGSHYQTLGELLLAGYTVAQAVVPGVFAFSLGALMYYWIFYQSKLVPRWLSVWGLIGVTLGMANGLCDMFGGIPNETISMVLDLPIFVQEMVLAVWLVVKGFNTSAMASPSAEQDQTRENEHPRNWQGGPDEGNSV